MAFINTDLEKKHGFSGDYTRVTGKEYNSMPYYKKDTENQFMFNNKKQWIVGKDLNEKNFDKVYGWVYSDNISIWPETNTLYFVNYPEAVNVTSEGGAGQLYPNIMGSYRIVPDLIFGGRPVWKHSERNFFLHYYQVWAFAPVLGDTDTTGIFTEYAPLDEHINIPTTGWVYKDSSCNCNLKDTSLTVT